MRPDQWPHQFVKDSPEYDYEGKKVVEMKCIHCKIGYVHGIERQPQGACPKREDKRELDRLLKRRVRR